VTSQSGKPANLEIWYEGCYAVVNMAAKLVNCTKEEQRSVIHFLWGEHVPGAQIHLRMCAQNGDKILSRRIAYEWIKMFENGRTIGTDAERSGCPATATTTRNEERTVELIREKRRKQVVPTLRFSLPAASSTVILLFSRISSRVLSSFLVVVAVVGRPERSASVTLVRPFSNISIHS